MQNINLTAADRINSTVEGFEMGEAPVENPSEFFKEESFQTIPSLLLRDLSQKNQEGLYKLNLSDIGVYAILKSHSRTKGNCYPSHERLAKLAAISVSTIQRSLKRLEDAGHVQRKGSIRGRIYILTDVAEGAKIVKRNRTDGPIKRQETNNGRFIEENLGDGKKAFKFGSTRDRSFLSEYLPDESKNEGLS